MKVADQFVIQTWCLYTHVRIDIWTFVCTHQTHQNPPTESLSPASPPVRAIAFSHPLLHMMGLVVLETAMSVLYTLTLCDPKTVWFTSWPSCTLYDHVFSFPRPALRILQMVKQSHFWIVYLFCFHSYTAALRMTPTFRILFIMNR